MEFFKVPEALAWQHDLIHDRLARAVKEGGKTGEAAKVVVEALRPHVAKEEDFALPALGLLQHLVAGKVSPIMRGVIVMTDRLKAQYEQMLQDHEAITAAIRKLADAVRQEDKHEYVGFPEKLIMHMKSEEQVLYPAAILVGEYLKLKLDELARALEKLRRGRYLACEQPERCSAMVLLVPLAYAPRRAGEPPVHPSSPTQFVINTVLRSDFILGWR